MQTPVEPLSDEQLARWAELGRACGIEHVEFMRGVFTAAATPANKRPPTEWLPLLLRTPPPSKAALVEFTRLCLSEYSVCEQLLELGVPAVPQTEEGEKPSAEALKQFCRGYMVLARGDDRWFKENSVFLATLPIAALAGLVTPESLATFHPESATDPAWLDKQADGLEERVVAIMKDFRARVPKVETPAESTKVGRNEPCPCGSGKKYKKCCGAAE